MTLLDAVRRSSPPSLLHQPAGVVGSLGQEAIDLAASVDIILDPWECDILEGGCSYRVDGSWAALRWPSVLPRQNGKGEVLLVRQLAGLFVLGERLQVHSAHEFKTCYEHFRAGQGGGRDFDCLRDQVRIVRTGAGDQAIELMTGARLRFHCPFGSSSGRGFTGDTVYLDEAFHLRRRRWVRCCRRCRLARTARSGIRRRRRTQIRRVLHGLRRRGWRVTILVVLVEWGNAGR